MDRQRHMDIHQLLHMAPQRVYLLMHHLRGQSHLQAHPQAIKAHLQVHQPTHQPMRLMQRHLQHPMCWMANMEAHLLYPNDMALVKAS
mmetsp:Transcript_62665/g.111723  ORF Transcript_62665/g.111723 Transcript_62665/m.111723 type:complete len:88 (-) Transcript_62665:427-690(-)